jgi:hypothetical protein
MAYKKVIVRNNEFNRKLKLLEDGLIVFVLFEKNGMIYFVAQRNKTDRKYFSCSEEIFAKNFNITNDDYFTVIENPTELKYQAYP